MQPLPAHSPDLIRLPPPPLRPCLQASTPRAAGSAHCACPRTAPRRLLTSTWTVSSRTQPGGQPPSSWCRGSPARRRAPANQACRRCRPRHTHRRPPLRPPARRLGRGGRARRMPARRTAAARGTVVHNRAPRLTAAVAATPPAHSTPAAAAGAALAPPCSAACHRMGPAGPAEVSTRQARFGAARREGQVAPQPPAPSATLFPAETKPGLTLLQARQHPARQRSPEGHPWPARRTAWQPPRSHSPHPSERRWQPLWHSHTPPCPAAVRQLRPPVSAASRMPAEQAAVVGEGPQLVSPCFRRPGVCPDSPSRPAPSVECRQQNHR